MRTLLIDSDINAFKAAAAVEQAIDWGDGYMTWHVEVDDAIRHLEDQIEDLKERFEPDDMIFALTDEHNFRMDVLESYKSNRKNVKRPLALKAVKQYIEDTYKTYKRPGLEGDDVLGILSTGKVIEGEKIIVSIDKDMKTIPGKFVHRVDDGILDISEEEADYWHMYQTLTGDATDGYKGCPGVGPVKADKILTSGPYWPKVVEAYEKAGLSEEEALVQARCARILRSSDYNFKTKEVILWNPQQ